MSNNVVHISTRFLPTKEPDDELRPIHRIWLLSDYLREELDKGELLVSHEVIARALHEVDLALIPARKYAQENNPGA